MGGRFTIESKAGEDRISELPNDVLCHILSFLTTKEAVATSLLSKRWRFLWTMVPSLDIDCPKPIMKLYNRVNVFLGLFRTQKITRFHLRCNNSHDCCSRYAEEWLNAVVFRKVEHVDISLNLCHSGVFRFPNMFICTTLVTLKLQGLFPFSTPCYVHLPNLKIFHLNVNAFLCFPSISKLISGSPALEQFYLKQNWGERELRIVRKHNSQVIQVFHRTYFYNLVIQDDFDFDCISNYMYNYRWPNILKAKVYMTVYHCTKNLILENHIVSKILRGLRNVEFLSLGDFREEMDPSILVLPHFENLVELRLFVKNADSPLLLEELPAKCPKLKVLEIHIMDDHYGINHRCRYYVTGEVLQHDLSIVPFLPTNYQLFPCYIFGLGDLLRLRATF